MDEKMAREITLTNLERTLKKNEKLFEVVAVSGSYENDIDVIIILSRENQKFINKFYSLLQIIKEVQDQLKNNHNVFLSAFPTFRLEIFDKELSKKSLPKDKGCFLQLHLLVYPDYNYFTKWENPMIVKTIALFSDIVAGDNKKLRKIGEDIKIPSFKDRVEYLLSLSLENYRFFTSSLLDYDILLREALHKTLYIVRYVAFNFLLEQNCDIRDISTWEKINCNKYKIKSKKLLNIFEEAYRWRKQFLVPPQNELLKLNQKILEILEDWLINNGEMR